MPEQGGKGGRKGRRFHANGGKGQAPNAAGGGATNEASDGQRVRKEQQQLLEELTQAEKEDGFEAARTLLERRSSTVSAGALARAHLELAERAKRASSLEQVKYHMLQALKVQPRAAQVWLDVCRTLDELGDLEQCQFLLNEHWNVALPQTCWH